MSHSQTNQLCLSHTQRSSLAVVEFRARYHGSPLKTTAIESDSRPIGTAFYYERRVRGLRSGIYDGVVLLSPGVASPEAPLRLDTLTDVFEDLDVATIRIVGAGLPIELVGGSRANQYNAEVTAQPSPVQEVMPLEGTYPDFLRRLGRRTRRAMLKCREQAKTKNIEFSISRSIELLSPLDIQNLSKKNLPFPVNRKHLDNIIQFSTSHTRQF